VSVSGRGAPVALPIDVAISVDDLPSHGPLAPGITRLDIARRLLDAFARHHVPGVYGFVNGKKVEDDPSAAVVLSEWLKAGYPLGNHTYSHLGLHTSTLAAYFADIEKGEAVLKQLEPDPVVWKVFRYPFLFEGETVEKRNAVRAWLGAHSYVIAQVTIDADDWAYNAPFARCAEMTDAATMAALRTSYVDEHVEELRRMRALTRALEQREVPQVLLLHAGVADADAVEELLTRYEREGVHWVDLRTAVADPFFSQDPALPARAGAAFPYRLAKARGMAAPPPVYARDLEARLDAICR
jgi:peptidoglycan/xylan/chitin deacetylase (PgdA/CDA1 family)